MDNMEIGKRIKQRRKELGLTQVQIHTETGISSGNLSLIENGKTLPSSSALIQLSNLLQCSIDYILKGETLNLKNEELFNFKDSSGVSPKDKFLIENFHKLSEYDQDEILAMIDLKIKRKTQGRKLSISHQDDTTETA